MALLRPSETLITVIEPRRTGQNLSQAKVYSEKGTGEYLVDQCWFHTRQLPKIWLDDYGRSVLSTIANHNGKASC